MENFKKDIYLGNEALDPFYLEQFKSLRSKIIHSIDSSGKSSIGITSATAEEGKTTISLNLASSIASITEKKVILIDCDMRKCDLTMVLGLYGQKGLSDFLLKENAKVNAIIHNSKIPNLYIISSGRQMRSPSELLTKGLFKNLIVFLKQKYDVVIVDLPPVISTADPITVKEIVDMFLLVYFSGKTPISLFESAINEIGKENILGAVLNGVTIDKIMKYRKYYYPYY